MSKLNRETATEIMDVVKDHVSITLEALLHAEVEDLSSSERIMFYSMPYAPDPIPDNIYKIYIPGKFKVYFILIPDDEYKSQGCNNYPCWIIESFKGNKAKKK